MRPTSTVALLLLLAMPLSAEEKGYARPNLLIEAGELSRAKDVVILDARTRKKYDQGHVPGARWVNTEEWRKEFKEGKDVDAWRKRLAALNVRLDAKVVVYDDMGSKEAARVWWVLRYWGIRDVRLLNGGWRGWEAGKHPVDTKEPGAATLDLTLQPQADRLATKEQLKDALKAKKLQVIDARCSDEFCGKLELAKRGGAVPTAKLLDWSSLIDEKTHRFKEPAELRRLFRDAGIALDRPSVTYCQSGGRASVMQFALELMGADHVCNYYQSWAEWGNADDTPIEAGKIDKPR